jgi:hypothetical protein
MTKHQKHDFDKSITTIGMKEEAMNGIHVLSSASIVIRASNASATCVKGTLNVISNQLMEFLRYRHPTSIYMAKSAEILWPTIKL